MIFILIAAVRSLTLPNGVDDALWVPSLPRCKNLPLFCLSWVEWSVVWVVYKAKGQNFQLRLTLAGLTEHTPRKRELFPRKQILLCLVDGSAQDWSEEGESLFSLSVRYSPNRACSIHPLYTSFELANAYGGNCNSGKVGSLCIMRIWLIFQFYHHTLSQWLYSYI